MSRLRIALLAALVVLVVAAVISASVWPVVAAAVVPLALLAPTSGAGNYRDRAAEIVTATADAFMLDQYSNHANPQAHFDTTGPEIWEQTDGDMSHLVCGVGTGGTVTGIARFLRSVSSSATVVGADPVGSIYSGGPAGDYLVEGVGEDFFPETFDRSCVDEYVRVSDACAFGAARALAQAEGLLTGGSSGLALYAAISVARRIDAEGTRIVVVLPDSGRSYLSKFYDDAWLARHVGPVPSLEQLRHGTS